MIYNTIKDRSKLHKQNQTQKLAWSTKGRLEVWVGGWLLIHATITSKSQNISWIVKWETGKLGEYRFNLKTFITACILYFVCYRVPWACLWCHCTKWTLHILLKVWVPAATAVTGLVLPLLIFWHGVHFLLKIMNNKRKRKDFYLRRSWS